MLGDSTSSLPLTLVDWIFDDVVGPCPAGSGVEVVLSRPKDDVEVEGALAAAIEGVIPLNSLLQALKLALSKQAGSTAQ